MNRGCRATSLCCVPTVGQAGVMSRRPRYRTGDIQLDESIKALVEQADLDGNHDLYTEIVTSAMRMGRERTDRGDVKIVNSALKELRNALSLIHI